MAAALSLAGAYGMIALQARPTSARPPSHSQAQLPRPVDHPLAGTASPISTLSPQGTTGPGTPLPLDSARPVAAAPDGHSNPGGTAGRTYSVLVGSFRYEPEAASLLDQLRGLGYQARAARVNSADRGAWHQVFVGPYEDWERAREGEARIRQIPGYADARLVVK